MDVTRSQAKAITDEALAEVRAVLERHGLTVDTHRVTYGDVYTLKVSAHVASTDASGADTASPHARAFLAMPAVYGLKAEALGATVQIPDKGARTFVGIAASRRKYPYAMQDASGKVMLFTESVVRHFPAELKA